MTPKPYKVVEDLENALAEYTGAPHVVCVSSCTIALEMVCAYLRVEEVSIPSRTYVSVPQAIVKAGGFVVFDDRIWSGSYSLNPYPLRDSAPRFTTDMYRGGFECLSFHRRKILGHTEGGAILCENADSARELRILRHDGREAGRTEAFTIGYHAVLCPGIAAELLAKAGIWDRPHEDMPCDNYPDVSLVDWNGMMARRRKVVAEDPLYTLRDANNKLFVKAWRRLQELDPVMWKEYQQGISTNDRKITELMTQ